MPLTSGPLRAEKKLMAGIMETLRTDDAQALAAGAVVRTDSDTSSVAEITHRNGAVTRLDRGSELVVDRVETDGRPRVVVTLGPGRTWHHTGPLDDPSMYEARCPAAILTARAAVFSVACRPDGSVDVAAVRGNVVVRGLASGSIALGDGQSVTVSGTGVLGEVGVADVDDWIHVNQLLDEPESNEDPAAGPEAQAEREGAGGGEDLDAGATVPLPRWVGRTLTAVAVVAFGGLLAVTFTSADHSTPTPTADGEDTVAVRSIAGPVSPLPAGAAAMIRAAQDRRVAPEPKPEPERPAPTKITPKAPMPTPAAAAPAPAPQPATATATAASCARRNGVILFSGRVKNTSQVASRFAVDTVFKTSAGRVFASKTATTSALAPGESRSWSVSVSSSGAASACDIAGVRPA